MIRGPARGANPSGRGPALVAALLLLSLAACDGDQGPQAQTAEAAPAAGVAQLWRVDLIGAPAAAGAAPEATVFACADDTLREQFVLTRARVNGRFCQDITPPTEKSRGWVLRCESKGRWFSLSSAAIGDEDKDFRLDVAMTPLFPDFGTVRQVRRFRRVGACPTGWRVGDQARPGEKPARRKG